tara:strand:+ start:221 stop:802 length:582 start_codon:yes stop_codon:yes gene_type:complete
MEFMILFFIVKVVFLTSFILDSKIMLRKIKLVLLLFLLSSTDVLGKDNKSRLSLGGGIYNFMKHGSDDFNQSSIAYNVELFSGKKISNFIRPFIGFLGTDESAYYAYFGLSTDLYFLDCKCFLLTPSLAVGAYEDGDQIRMGNTIEFRSGADIMYRFKNNVRVGFGVFHISNAGIGYRNPGSEQVIFKYQIPF